MARRASNNYFRLTLGQRPFVIKDEILKPIDKRFILNINSVVRQEIAGLIKLTKGGS